MSEDLLSTVRTLAGVAGLALDDERVEQVAATLAGWLPPADELSAMMAAEEFRAVLPVTVFTHPVTAEVAE